MTLELDWETRSEIDLLTRGPYVYAMHPSTEALIASYQIDGGEIKRWKRGEPCPADIRAHVEAGGMISAHNAAFERLIWWFVMSDRYGWPRPKLEQFRCTATTAAAMSLPRSLERLAVALDLADQKDKRGKTLIKIHSVPVSFDAAGKPTWHEKVDDPESVAAFHDYCDGDVRAEAAADARLVPLSESEQAVYVLAERINDRGIRVDVQSARAALKIIERAKRRVNDELAEITGRRVRAVTETAKMKKWIADQGVEMPSMDKDDVEEFLNDIDDLPDNVRRVLELRQEGAKPSVEKIGAMLDRVCDDGRARGVYLTHGAGQTGRFSSRGLQAHNMPKYRKEFEKAVEDKKLRLDTLFQVIRTGEPEAMEWMYGPSLGRPLHLLSDAVRSFLWAAPGHEFINADFTSIEGVMGAWFAGEEWKLQAFRDLFSGVGHGIYELTAAGIYGIPVEDVTKAHRPTGKVAELSCIEEGQLVLTDMGLFPIEKVPLYSKVWDGLEWVSHDGPIFRGFKDVIEYQGLRATPDHIVFTEEGRSVPFGRCADEQISIAQTGLDGSALRLGGSDLAGSILDRREEGSSWIRPTLSTSENALHELRQGEDDQHGQPSKRQDEGVPAMFETAPDTTMVGPTTDCGEGTLREPERSGLQELWRQGREVLVPVRASSGAMDHGASGTSARHGHRSDQERRPLRAMEHPVHAASREYEQSPDYRHGGDRGTVGSGNGRHSPVPSSVSDDPLCGPHAHSLFDRQVHTSRDHREMAPTVVQTKRPVWDILNAGPRNRFTVSGRLVHNCQYQTGAGGIRKFARQNKIKLPTLYAGLWDNAEPEAREKLSERFAERLEKHDPHAEYLGREGWIAAELIKTGWRTKHRKIVEAWADLDQAMTEAVETPGLKTYALSNRVAYRMAHGFLWCLLPSGRCLAYGKPRIENLDAPWADKTVEPAKREKKLTVTALGVDPQTEKWVRSSLYGGKLFNNVVQGSARDILVHGMQNAEAAGYPIVLHTHDECMAELPIGQGDYREFEKIICQLPTWATGMPMKSSGWAGKRYRKD